MKKSDYRSHHERWAHLRFAVVGQLLAAPPPKRELRGQLEKLAARDSPHSITGLPVRFGISTLERWLHKARAENHDPVRVLRRKVRADVGAHDSMSLAIREALRAQYAGHMSWSVALHHVNLRALAEQRPELGFMPSYSTIRRFLKAQGLFKRRRLSARRTAGVERAEARLLQREVRSYEAEHVGALWHVDAHHGSLKVVRARAMVPTRAHRHHRRSIAAAVSSAVVSIRERAERHAQPVAGVAATGVAALSTLG